MIYDVVKQYDWTSSPRGSGMRKKAPHVHLTSYKVQSNQIMTTIDSYLRLGKAALVSVGGNEFYDKMYKNSTKKEDDFFIPFFSDSVREFGNNFGDTFQSGSGGGGGILGNVAGAAKSVMGGVADFLNITDTASWGEATDKLIKNGDIKGAWESIASSGNPGTYVETPKFYEYTSGTDAPLQVEFVLYNTINSDFNKNYELIKKLTKINRPLRINPIAAEPPRIYQVKVPGHRFIRWAYCSQFGVQLQGARREINKVVVPEAYKITMSFTSLTMEHSGFIDQA